MAARPQTFFDRFLVTPPGGGAHERRFIAAARLLDSGRAFEATGNPLDAWFAISMAWAAGEPVPESVLLYFVQSAARLLTAPVPRKGRIAKVVVSAIGFNCRTRADNPFVSTAGPSTNSG
jgi:hypothetical protein